MAAKFVVKKGPTGKFRFSLHGKSGRVLAISEAYNSKAACMNGIRAVKDVAGDADIDDQTTKAAAQQADVKATTKVAAKAAKQAIAKATNKTDAAAKRTGAATKKTHRTLP